jgi:enoyl-CoA hydratase/carnithine racemase
MPPRVALELLIVAAPISATRAFELGLVNRLAPPGEVDAAAGELGAAIAANAPLSVAAGKRMVYASVGLELPDAFARADEIYAPAYLSEDAQEGPRAFRERREPHWRGR